MPQGHMLHNLHSSLICIIQKLESTQMSHNRQIEKMWLIYTMEYISIIKNEEIISFAVKWMELEKYTMWGNMIPKGMHGMYSLISEY